MHIFVWAHLSLGGNTMTNSLTSLLPGKYRSSLKGISHLVLSAFESGASKQSRPQLNDGLDTSSEDNCHKSLLSVIESQIIPQLMQAHPDGMPLTGLDSGLDQQFSDAEVADFSHICLSNHADQALQYVKALRDQGASIESLFLNLIAPAARWLGRQWEEDKMDFTAVTHGLMCMHQLTRSLGYTNPDSPQTGSDIKRIMLACAPGSMHILGLAMVAEFFRAKGWQVVVEIATTENALFNTLKREWFDMIGLSVGLVEQLPELPQLIARLKSHALNPDTLVILGGPALLLAPELAQQAGADGYSVRAPEAVELADKLLESR
jgi:hypothetical protein